MKPDDLYWAGYRRAVEDEKYISKEDRNVELRIVEGKARILDEWISSRICSDHNGKWERGKGCLLCKHEQARKLLKDAIDPFVSEVDGPDLVERIRQFLETP